MTPIRLLARPLLASGFIVGGISALRNSEALASKAKPVTDKLVPPAQNAAPSGVTIPSDPQTLVRINAAAQILGGAALATGKAPRLASGVLAASLAPTTMAGHPFWQESDKATRKQQQLQFFKNLSMLGGVLLAAVDTEGKPGVAWRARRAARDVRREAKQLGKQGAMQGKLAKANLT